jgi:glycosyltransferase involved in cell wall biosynthesis
LLVPPGNPDALAAVMAAALSDAAAARRRADAAAARVASEYDAARLLPRHAALAGRIVAKGSLR